MPPPRRVLLHVGLQKTGTSFLQDAMLASADALAAQGLDLVPPTKRECFETMVVLRDRYAARRDEASDAAILDRFRRRLAEAPGDRAVFSQESLAGAGPGQVRRTVELCEGREVHVVLTVRDLARQLPSSWQQELKAGSTVTREEWFDRLVALEGEGRARFPWIHLEPPAVLRRWADEVGPERVHVVTVPPPGAAPSVLLERFARVLEVDPASLVAGEKPANTSLGLVQAEVLRRVNAELPEEVHKRYVYSDQVKRFFAAGVLGSQTERERILVPARHRAWCEEVTARHVREIAAAGHPVVGDLDDLQVRPEAFDAEGQHLDDAAVVDAAVLALARMLTLRARPAARRRNGRIGADAQPPALAAVLPEAPARRLRRLAGRLRRAVAARRRSGQ